MFGGDNPMQDLCQVDLLYEPGEKGGLTCVQPLYTIEQFYTHRLVV